VSDQQQADHQDERFPRLLNRGPEHDQSE
jgi:hypothetical protein